MTNQRAWRIRYISDTLSFTVQVTAAHPQTAMERGVDKIMGRLRRLGDDVMFSGQHTFGIVEDEHP
jgi:hypothetical protein